MVSQVITLPPTADLRPQCPPVVDQGQIGSCTANSSASAMAFLEHQGHKDKLFSRLFIYAMTRTLEGTPLSEDSGAEIRDVMKALAQYGVPYETEWPYDTSKFSVMPPAQAKTDALQHKAVMYLRCPSLYTVKASLHQGFPVVIGFSVPDNMMSEECAQSGIVLPPAPDEAFDGGHAVLAVGYDDNFMCGDEKGAIICQNSWGTGWGVGGYFYLPMSFWSGGAGALASDCWTIRRAEV
jgi:C1A family cysteine protease